MAAAVQRLRNSIPTPDLIPGFANRNGNTTVNSNVNSKYKTKDLKEVEIDLLKKTWFDTLSPEFPEDVVGERYPNILTAVKSQTFWSKIVELIDEENLDNLNLTMSLEYYLNSQLSQILILVMVSIEDLCNGGLTIYLNRIGLEHLRIHNTDFTLFKLWKIITLELMKLSFADAFDLDVRYCWLKLFDTIIDKITSVQDLRLKNPQLIFSKEDIFAPKAYQLETEVLSNHFLEKSNGQILTPPVSPKRLDSIMKNRYHSNGKYSDDSSDSENPIQVRFQGKRSTFNKLKNAFLRR